MTSSFKISHISEKYPVTHFTPNGVAKLSIARTTGLPIPKAFAKVPRGHR